MGSETLTQAYDSTAKNPAIYAIADDLCSKMITRKIIQIKTVCICLTSIGNSANICIHETAQLEFMQPAFQMMLFAIYQFRPNTITTAEHMVERRGTNGNIYLLCLPFSDNRSTANANLSDSSVAEAKKLNVYYSSKLLSGVIKKETAII